MALDPQARMLLDQMAAMGTPPLESLPVPDARALMGSMTAMLGQPEPIEHVEDRTVPGPAGDVPVRFYRPAASAPLPLLVYFHGGGWVLGDLATHDGLCRSLANAAGCAVLAVDYRLAPEHKFPAAADDAYAAAAWAAANAAALGVAPGRLAIGGDSAGGNLTAVVALMARDRGEPRFTLQVLVYPVTDARFDTPSYRENADGYFLTKQSMVWFWSHYLEGDADGANPYASPLRATDLRGLPPAYVITAGFDPLRDEAEAYAARLRAAGVPVTLERYDGMIHGFFTMGTLLEQGKVAVTKVAAALKTALA